MATPLFTYRRPGATLVSSPPQTIQPASVTGNVELVLGQFPRGPHIPTLTDAAGAASLFGSASAASSNGYWGPLSVSKMALQRNPTGFQAPSYLICRVGVQLATAAVVDGSSGTCFSLAGIGQYAGSAGTNLAYTVTVTGGAVTNIAFYDVSSGSPVLLQQLIAGRNTLTSNQSIVDEINGLNPLYSSSGAPTQSIVQATIGTSSLLPVQVSTPTTFSQGTPNDGAAATASDASIAFLLNESLRFNVQFITPLFDGQAIAATIQAHQAAAVARLQWRFAYVGPTRGTSYASLASTYSAGIASSQVAVVAHDGYQTTNPITGNPLIVPGYVFAAAAMALKAGGPAQETTTKQVVAGFTDIAVAPGKTGALDDTSQNALAVTTSGNGQIVTSVDPASGGIAINHALTTAPYTFNGGINAFSEVNAQIVDNTYNSMLVQQSSQLIGRVFKKIADQQTAILRQVNTGAAALDNAGTINGYAHQLSRDTATGATVVGATYGLPVGTNYINYQSGGVQVQG